MSWKPLKERIEELPLILCGPILRRCEPDSVTVWVALKNACIVTLRVYSRSYGVDSRLKIRMIGTRYTSGLGTNFKATAVTAQLELNDEKLTSGELYYYNLFFQEVDDMPDNLGHVPENLKNLHTDGILNNPEGEKLELHYSKTYPNIHEELHLPTFSLPPDDLDNLRVIHGSCRKLHNEGLDAMPGIDDILEFDWIVANSRPHMLFLTGDQIYADDISDTLLFLLNDASDALMGWTERLSGLDQHNELLRPGNRKEIVRDIANFTTGDGHNHLLRLGEFYGAYLFSWSDVLWPQEDVDYPMYAEAHPRYPQLVFTKRLKKYNDDKKRLLALKGTLHKVRRAMANIPTYMIFDDHDVTDDWNMTSEWCEETLREPLGYQVTQNALLAFAVFQAWGNTPAQFFENENSSGAELLKEAQEWNRSNGTNVEARKNIAKWVGLPTHPFLKIFVNDIDGSKILDRHINALNWHYCLKWPKFEVLFLDTRTRHSYPGGKTDPAALLSASAFKEQIDDQQDPGTLVTFVIAPTPVITLPFFRTFLFWLVALGGWKKVLRNIPVFQKLTPRHNPYEVDIPDHWQNQEEPFELLLAKLASRGAVTNNIRRSRVIILTGDVHFSSNSRLQFWADRPFIEKTSTSLLPTEAIFAHFSASSFKKQDLQTQYLHTHGYEFNEIGFALNKSKKDNILSQILLNIPVLSATLSSIMELLNKEPDSTFCFGVKKLNPISNKEEPKMYIAGNLAWLWDHLKFVSMLDRLPKFDWIYRIDFILAENEVREPAPFEPSELILPVDEERRDDALKNYLAMSRNHQDYAKKMGNGKEIVGVNNFCEITFDWSDEGPKAVIQKSWWRLKSKSNDDTLLQVFPLSKFSVPLEFEDLRYKLPHIKDISDLP